VFFVDLELPAGPAALESALESALAELQPLCEHLALFGAYPISNLALEEKVA
jgi:prephenate dehydratase